MGKKLYIRLLIAISVLLCESAMADPFTCDSEIYQVQSGQLRIFDTTLSEYVDVD